MNQATWLTPVEGIAARTHPVYEPGVRMSLSQGTRVQPMTETRRIRWETEETDILALQEHQQGNTVRSVYTGSFLELSGGRLGQVS